MITVRQRKSMYINPRRKHAVKDIGWREFYLPAALEQYTSKHINESEQLKLQAYVLMKCDDHRWFSSNLIDLNSL